MLHIDLWQTHQLRISKTGFSSSLNKKAVEKDLMGWQPEGQPEKYVGIMKLYIRSYSQIERSVG